MNLNYFILILIGLVSIFGIIFVIVMILHFNKLRLKERSSKLVIKTKKNETP